MDYDLGVFYSPADDQKHIQRNLSWMKKRPAMRREVSGTRSLTIVGRDRVMMRLRNWITGITAGVFMLAGLATGASAATIDLGDLAVPSATNSGNVTAEGNFSDDFRFTVAGDANLEAAVAINNGQGFNINPGLFEVSLLENNVNTGAVAVQNGLLFTLAHSGLTAASEYILRVSGTASGFGGNYGVLLNLAGDVAPVPLPPAAWLFISALLGLISLARMRRDRAGQPAA